MSAKMRNLIADAVECVAYDSSDDLEMSVCDKYNMNMQHSGPQSTALF
jgi:hypothetical protein